MRALIATCVLFVSGCVSGSECDEPTGFYTASLTRLSGTCSSSVMVAGDLCFTCALPSNCMGNYDPSPDLCQLTMDFTCQERQPDGSDQFITFEGELHQAADRGIERLGGIITVRVRGDTGALICEGEYDMDAERL